MRFQIFSTLALMATALAEQSVIASQYAGKSLRNLDVAVINFDNGISSWKGDYLGVAPLLQQSSDLIVAINTAADVPWDPSVVKIKSQDQEEQYTLAEKVIGDVGHLVDTIIRIKVKVQAIPVGPTLTLGVIVKLRDAASRLAGTYAQFASEDRKEKTAALLKTLDDHIARAQAAYEEKN